MLKSSERCSVLFLRARSKRSIFWFAIRETHAVSVVPRFGPSQEPMKNATSPRASSASSASSASKRCATRGKREVLRELRLQQRVLGLRGRTLPQSWGAGGRGNQIPAAGCPLYCLSTRVCHNIERSDEESVEWKTQRGGRGGSERKKKRWNRKVNWNERKRALK